MQHATYDRRRWSAIVGECLAYKTAGGRGRQWSLLVCGVNSRLRLYLFFIRRRGESADLRAA